MLSSVASSQEWSTILSIASLKISTDAFTISTQIATLAIGSRIGKPSLAPKIPINAPTEDIASERWCHASAISAPEFIFFAALLVYQNIHSFTTIETTAAISANVPGIAMLVPEVLLIMFSIPFIPIPIPVARSNPDKIMDDTHSIRSCPYWCSLSDFLLDKFTPTITTKVLPTSDAEWIASEIMAPECATIPASNLNKESNRFTAILTPDTFIATLCSHAGSSFLAVVLLFVLSDIAVMFNFFVCSITRTS